MTIKEICEQFDITADTLRYYERVSVIPTVSRTKGGIRDYSEEDMAWWNTHPADVNKQAFYSITCQHCGKDFLSYGNKNRKYCSRECYSNARSEAKLPIQPREPAILSYIPRPDRNPGQKGSADTGRFRQGVCSPDKEVWASGG